MPNATPQQPAARTPFVSRTHLFRAIRKQFVLFAVTWASLVMVAALWTYSQAPIYRADAMIRLNPDPPRVLGNRVELVSAGGANYWNRREFYESEFRVIKSMKVGLAVVRSLGLQGDPGFLGVKPANRASFKPVTAEQAATVLLGRLSVDPVRDTSLAYVRYEDTDPKRARLVANAVVRVYLEKNLEATTSLSNNALEWLNGQLSHLKVELESSEKAINEFRLKNNVLSINLEDRTNLLSAEMEQLTKEAASLLIRRSLQASRVAELNTAVLSDPLAAGATEFLQSAVLTTLRTSYAMDAKGLAELAETLGDSHPKVLAARARLDSTKKQITQEISNIKDAAVRELRSIDRQLADLHKREDELKKEGHELRSLEVTYNQLNRSRINNEKVYSLVLERSRETDLTRMLNVNNAQVVDDALEPTGPVKPNKTVNIAVGALLGFALATLLALARELSDSSIKTPEEIEQLGGATCLGVIPEIATASRGRRKTIPAEKLADRDLTVAHQPDGGVAEALRVIRTNLAFMSPDRPYQATVLSSAVPEEGKSTVACSLAITLAQSGHRTLLVDTDLRRPRLHRAFKISNDVGVSMLVTGQATLDEAVHDGPVPNLVVLPAGPIPPNPAELLESDRFREIVKELRGKYDRIIFDSPPLLPVTDAAILSQCVDGTIVVARAFRTPRTAVERALRHLKDVNAHLIGVILNDVDTSRRDYAEYHYYYRRDGYYRADDSEST